jgi:glycosyltransferase involved in cell wall biosynthesis
MDERLGKEREWWGGCANTADEEAKQEKYASMMGLDVYRNGVGWHCAPPLDMRGKSVLDIGGGPVSLLLKCQDVKGTVLDPIRWPEWVHLRYRAAGIEYVQAPAELYDFGHVFDEVWIYNVLQHVQDPAEVIATALRHGRTIRVWDWLGGVPNAQHPHVLTREHLDRLLGATGKVAHLGWERYLHTAYVSVVNTKCLTRNAQPDANITVAVVSCGRYDLLERTLGSFEKTAGRDWPVVIIDDSEDDEQHEMIVDTFGHVHDVYIYPRAHGQAWALDTLYGLVTTPYIFQCEDDWEFLESGYIEKALDILESCPDVGIVGLAKSKEFEEAGAVGKLWHTPSGTAYYEHPRWRLSENHDWWNGSVLSPSLRRRADFRKMPFQQAKNEAQWDSEIWAKSGLRGAWLDGEYVRHIGQGRTMKDPAHSNWLVPESVKEHVAGAVVPLHFISTDPAFPYTYYIGVKSAIKTQNVTEVNFWATVEPEGPWFEAVRDDVTLRLLEEPQLKALKGRDRKFKAAHIKDYLLWQILYEHGGLYMDLDTLSVRDITCLMDGSEVVAPLRVKSLDTHPWPLESAVIMARPQSDIVASVKRFAEAKVQEEEMAWADMAYIPLSTVAMENLEKVRVLPKEACVPYCGGEVLYDLELPEEAYVLHLQGSHLPAFHEFNDVVVEEANTLYAKTIRQVLTHEERHPYMKSRDMDSWYQTRGERMRPMFEELSSGTFHNILEIGTYDGENALRMIEAASLHVPVDQINYYGFDLFSRAPQEELSWSFAGDVEDVRRKLEKSGAKVSLTKGDTKVTLPQADLPVMDFVFIDGGHSVETLRSDWEQVQRFTNERTVIYLDDYYPEIDFVGCKFLEKHLDVLPETDVFEQEWGRLKIQLARAKPVEPRLARPTLQQRKFRFHLLGLPHVPTHPDATLCAYTQKVVKLGKMLKEHLGHTVYAYVGEGSDLACDEMVQCVSNDDRIEAYGDYNWYVDFFKFDSNDHAYRTFNENAVREIRKRGQKGDFILFPFGYGHQLVAETFRDEMFCVESGIGYRGIFSNYRVFESHSWMQYMYGSIKQDDGSWYDAVIPNCFDSEDFPFQPEKEDYALYIGRLVRRKGVDIALQVTRELGMTLVMAGQGSLVNPAESLNITNKSDPHVQFLGSVGPEVRKHLMGRAKFGFVPTYYIEPFGGVAVETMMCGTPVLTTDWGVFPETVLHGVTGFRCRTFDDFLWSARNIDQIDPLDCRNWAVSNFSLERVARMYQEYFEKVHDISNKGWYQEHPERTDLEWKRKYYPGGVDSCVS